MMNQADNELLTRIGPGTPMGAMLREYWVPGVPLGQARGRRRARADPPVRRELRRLPRHRRPRRVHAGSLPAPLRQPRARAQRGQRPALRVPRLEVQRRGPVRRRADRAARASASASPPACRCAATRRTRRAGWCGSTWARRQTPPRFPDYEFTTLADDQVQPYRGIIRTNWLQGLEALLDSAHVTFLHSANLMSERGRNYFKAESDYMLNDGAPAFEFDERPYGFREGAIREEGEARLLRPRARGRAAVLLVHPLGAARARASSAARSRSTTSPPRSGTSPTTPTRRCGPTCSARSACGRAIPTTSTPTWAGPRTCGTRTAQAMKDGHWSGITGRGNAYEDFAVQESMGADRRPQPGIPRHLRPGDLPRAQAAARGGQAPPRHRRAVVRRRRHRLRRASARSASPTRARRTGARSIRTSCGKRRSSWPKRPYRRA